MRSTYREAAGQLPLSVCVAATIATLPPVALNAMLPEASGADKSCPHGVEPAQPEPDASLIRRY
jgi:hypothetical protein